MQFESFVQLLKLYITAKHIKSNHQTILKVVRDQQVEQNGKAVECSAGKKLQRLEEAKDSGKSRSL